MFPWQGDVPMLDPDFDDAGAYLGAIAEEIERTGHSSSFGPMPGEIFRSPGPDSYCRLSPATRRQIPVELPPTRQMVGPGDSFSIELGGRGKAAKALRGKIFVCDSLVWHNQHGPMAVYSINGERFIEFLHNCHKFA